MPSRSNISIVILSLGTLVSIGVGFGTSVIPEIPFYINIVFGLLTEIVVLILALIIFVKDHFDGQKRLLIDANLLVEATDYVATKRDPNYQNLLFSLKSKLKELAVGDYVISDLPSVYIDDEIAMGSLKKDDTLLSMCPVSSDAEKVRHQFTNKSFKSSMQWHYKMKEKGVEVKRIYIFQEKCILDQVDKCREHICRANEKISIKIVFLDDPRFEDAKIFPHDVIIFGENKVSVGKIGPNSSVDGADVFGSREQIKIYKRKYQQLERLAETYEEATKSLQGD